MASEGRSDPSGARLRRLMCGKAAPFRQLNFKELRGFASIRRHSLLALIDGLIGKAKPYRTSGGKAAATPTQECLQPCLFREQRLNHILGLVITPFANMQPANAALFVEHEDCGPCLHLVRFPGCVIIVSDDSVFYSQCWNFLADVVEDVLAVSFRRMYANDSQPTLAILRIPLFDRGQSVPTVVAAEGPEFDEHNASTQVAQW